ncbi:hypothetical protein GCM10011375_12200 [Hymenobacter qilianensis]|uniref:Uncharacterized protein n=1 Tax=Hymenobacter qilianensis TaxID=1385715 RepID=A0ACB5PPE1_9BACT|nr:hypothetical protein GCM10011375_12200 [Hymenobacter qilianensis]
MTRRGEEGNKVETDYSRVASLSIQLPTKKDNPISLPKFSTYPTAPTSILPPSATILDYVDNFC